MKKIAIIVVTAFVLASVGMSAVSAEDKWFEGEIKAGGTTTLQGLHSDESGSKGGTEYNAVVGKKWTTVLGGSLSADVDGFAMDFDGLYRDVYDQDYEGALSLKRIIVYKTDYSRFLHRLDHDYMSNLNAHIFDPNTGKGIVIPNPPLPPSQKTVGSANVYHTDRNPDDMYQVARSVWKNQIDFHIPQIPELNISFNHRFEGRKGEQQARTSSKCLACHVVGMTKEIDETTNDWGPTVGFKIGTMAAQFSYNHREFSTSDSDMEIVYNGLKKKELFNNRLQYDRTTGELPFNRTPESTKDSYKGKFRWDINSGNTLVASYVYAKSTNKSTDGNPYDILMGNYDDEIELSANTFTAKYTSRISRAFTFNVFGNYTHLENDEVYIEENVRTNPAKAPGGAVTLSEGYGDSYFEEAYDRKSGYDSDAFKLGVDVTWRILHGLKVKGEYNYVREERDNYDIHHVPETTQEHIFKIGGDYHLGHNLKFALDYKMELVDDAYALHHASCAPNGSYGTYGGLPGSLYDMDRAYAPKIYEPRTATRSNQPNFVNEVKFKTYWHALSMLDTSLHVKYKYAQNDDLDGRDYTQNLLMAGFNVILTPLKGFVVSAGYNYMRDSYESQYCIALYDG
jgi:hypothetical protein